MSFFSLFRSRAKPSATEAKERLQILLAHERSDLAKPDYLPRLHKELLQVIAKYVEIEEDKIIVARARKIQQFLSQNTYMATKFTNVEGSTVPLAETIESFKMICDGEVDHVAEQAFFNVGGISDVEEKWAKIQKENG